MTYQSPEQVQLVLLSYDIKAIDIQPVNSGLINMTWHVRADNGVDYILQAVNRMFSPEVNHDIDVVTRHLEKSGLLTPKLLLTKNGAVFHRENNQTWRMFNYIHGNIHHRLDRPRLAEAAGVMLGRMHMALNQLDYEFQTSRPGVHDTVQHMQRLESALENKRAHERYEIIKPLGENILALSEQLPELPVVSKRIVHGDPKISNFVFASDNRKVECMVDFDTLSKMPIYLEVGDALRSWCNPMGEDSPEGYFSTRHCRAALEGYASYAREFLTEREGRGFLPATLTIYVELAARFCADALNEDFFSWNASKFKSHSEHSETRARGQLSAANSILSQYDEISNMVNEIFICRAGQNKG